MANMSNAFIDTLAFEFEIDARVGGYTRDQKALSFVRALESALPTDRERDTAFLDVAARLLKEPRAQSVLDGGEVGALLRSLQLDGYASVDGALRAEVPLAAAPAEPVSWLEVQLRTKALDVAAQHFSQGVENFASGNWEACNSQIRAFAEAILREAATRRAGKEFADPSSALQHLQQVGILVPEEAQYAKGPPATGQVDA